MPKKLLPLTVLLFLAAPAWAAPDVTALFGPRVHARPGNCLTGDFDGDGVADTACLVLVMPASAQNRIAPDVTVIDRLFGTGRLGAKSQETALAILQKTGKQKYLVTGGGYFDTPIWTTHALPLGVAKRGSKAFRGFQSDAPQIKNDVLVLGTEAGIDTALYWNGKSYVLFAPNEEP